jgi:hypothetical protein
VERLNATLEAYGTIGAGAGDEAGFFVFSQPRLRFVVPVVFGGEADWLHPFAVLVCLRWKRRWCLVPAGGLCARPWFAPAWLEAEWAEEEPPVEWPEDEWPPDEWPPPPPCDPPPPDEPACIEGENNNAKAAANTNTPPRAAAGRNIVSLD